MDRKRGRPKLENLRLDFDELRDLEKGERRIKELLFKQESSDNYLADWLKLSKIASQVYPSQGLLQTPYDFLGKYSLQMLPQEMIVKTLRIRRFLLELFNHPYRIHYLGKVDKEPRQALTKVDFGAMERAIKNNVALSVGDLAATVKGDQKERISRAARYAQGPFVKLGRQARLPFTGSASPDVWNSSMAIATMAASHGLATIPRNGLLSEVKRQADVAAEVFNQLEKIGGDVLRNRSDKERVMGWWKSNVMGTLEASEEKALLRAVALYEKGVRVFRIYSPEPGTGLLQVTKRIRREFGTGVEIFVGQIISVEQAKQVEAEGADGIYVGIGGGGRCITGVRSGTVIDWPQLVWRLRGETKLPVVVEGGASDHVATSLLLGATAISTSRVVSGGTIESPGGALFCSDDQGRLFKPYGGEASARAKYLDQKLLPFEIPAFVEGETTRALMSYVSYVYPTLTYNLHCLIEDSILTLVFRGVENILQLQELNPSPLRQITAMGGFQQGTH